jgi:hypothetical protein
LKLKNSNLDSSSTFHTYKKEKGGGKYQFETRGTKSNKIIGVAKRYSSKEVKQEEWRYFGLMPKM